MTHPKPVAWNALFKYISATLGVELVPYSDWLSRLQASETHKAVGQNPALRLLDFYKSVPTESKSTEAAGLPILATDAARKVSHTLGDENLRPVGPEDAKKWLDYWNLIPSA